MLLMMKDIPVMHIDFSKALYEVINKQLSPYQMKGRLRFYTWDNNASMRYNTIQVGISAQVCYDAVVSFLARRVLSLDREMPKRYLMS